MALQKLIYLGNIPKRHIAGYDGRNELVTAEARFVCAHLGESRVNVSARELGEANDVFIVGEQA